MCNLDVLDDQMVRVQPLVLGIALRVLQEVQQELGRLERPPALSGPVNLDNTQREVEAISITQLLSSHYIQTNPTEVW